MMIVVLDTTEMFDDLRLDGPRFQLLEAYFKSDASRLAIPSIVFEETVNHFRERLAKNCRETVKNTQELAKLTGGRPLKIDTPLNEIKAVNVFRAHLKSRIKSLHGDVIGFEKVELSELIQRSLQRRKPFDKNGQDGFRDAVLWETILHELLAIDSSTTVALITRNTSDFGENGTLAESLAEDCMKIGRARDAVRLFHSLSAFIDAEVKPHLKTMEGLRKKIADGSFMAFNPNAFFVSESENLTDHLSDYVYRKFDCLTRSMSRLFKSPDLRSLESEPTQIEVTEVWGIGEDKVAAGIHLTLDGVINCIEHGTPYVPNLRSDEQPCYYEQEFFGEAQFHLYLTVILNKNTGEVDEYEIDEIETILGHRW